ncbi:rhodanese-like domain-containing protein [Arsenicicoccus piscis]|uniref:Rhodanese domain-containing protein n=1 Tax=Arsenicicoccus piscis TaxID=673954 RepID=A0ABQ6HM26_9MICO|nr:rhodanese-like domain-containing protein [Arsenicicoccus piscis]MCH8626939.1 rhodanese-like domain-containing protein [Arsenicicoccus piscis]GMA19143.1 hypothetical protein GCM10025862_11640 [Arsenicicoccus piscis]
MRRSAAELGAAEFGAEALGAEVLGAEPGGRALGVSRMLDAARARLSRLTPLEAWDAVRSGDGVLIDVRTEAHRRAQGELPGAIVIDLTVLEWRLDPAFAWRIPEATSYDTRWIVTCRQGYSSSLAAMRLQQLGLHRATDLVDGVQGWLAAGLPLHDGVADVRP